MKKLALPFMSPVTAALLVAVIAASNLFGRQIMSTTENSSNLDESAMKADEFLSQWDKKDMPGCSVGAIKDGTLVYKRAVGLANLDYDIPNTTSTTLFNLASASKPFTAASIALLAQQGKLSLADDIRKYLPEIPSYGETITIQHLLNHTSGIREYQALALFGGLGTDSALSESAVLKMLARQKNSSFAPGSKYQYSNSNYQLLGTIVARASGKSLRDFADENIFKPLGMKNTRFFDNRNDVVKNRAVGYMVGPGNRVRTRASLFDLVGGGGVLTTVEDLYLWDQNFYEPKVGNKELISTLTTAGTLKNGEKINYGFGLFRNVYKGLPVIKHSGNMAGYRAQIIWFPEQKFTAIALCNNTAIYPSAIVEKLADIYLDGLFKPGSPDDNKPLNIPAGVPVTEKDALRYTGIYAHLESGRVFKLSAKEGKLVESAIFKKDVPVTVISGNRLIVADGNGMAELNLVLDKSGAVSEIRITNEMGKPDVFVPVKPTFEEPERLSEYAGTYHSDEFDAYYTISVKGKGIVFQIGDAFELQLNGVYADTFAGANGQLSFSFKRGENGKVTGFVFNSAVDEREVKGVVFNRR